MADFLDATYNHHTHHNMPSDNDKQMVELEAMKTRQKYWDMGYREGIDREGKISGIQKDFDAGYLEGAMGSFVQQFCLVSNDLHTRSLLEKLVDDGEKDRLASLSRLHELILKERLSMGPM